MQGTLRMAHLVVGAIAVVAFLITGMLMTGHDPPVSAMEWGERLLFRSRHIYLLCGGLVSTVLLFFAFFSEAMAGRSPGYVSSFGLFTLFGGVLLYAVVSLRRTGRSA